MSFVIFKVVRSYSGLSAVVVTPTTAVSTISSVLSSVMTVAVSFFIFIVNASGAYGILAVHKVSFCLVIVLPPFLYVIVSTVSPSTGVPETVTVTATPPLM